MTAPKTKPRATPPSGQLHTDFGILTQRVTTMEDAFHTVASDVATLRRENREDFEGLAKDLGNRITLQAAKPTDWRSIIGLIRITSPTKTWLGKASTRISAFWPACT